MDITGTTQCPDQMVSLFQRLFSTLDSVDGTTESVLIDQRGVLNS